MSIKKATALVENPSAIAKHSFWPLIQFQVKTSKIKQDKATGSLVWHTKEREISYAAHSDSLIYSFYANKLSELYEEELRRLGLEACVLAFRSQGKNNIDFAKDAFDEIRNRGNCVAVALDVTKFFDTINHTQLKQQWKGLLKTLTLPKDHYAVFKALTKYSFVDRNSAFQALGVSIHTPRSTGRHRLCSPAEFRSRIVEKKLINTNSKTFGIPQGTAISALLSNLYMIKFDEAAQKFARDSGGRYMRYCDDILFIMPNERAVETEHFCESEVTKLGLSINRNKTDTCIFTKTGGIQTCSRPLQYLGFLFDGRQAVIRSAAFAKFSNRMKRGISLAKRTMRSRNSTKLANGATETSLYLRKIFSRYTHLGKRNFLRYGYQAADKMKSKAIRRQLRPLWARLQRALAK